MDHWTTCCSAATERRVAGGGSALAACSVRAVIRHVVLGTGFLLILDLVLVLLDEDRHRSIADRFMASRVAWYKESYSSDGYALPMPAKAQLLSRVRSDGS